MDPIADFLVKILNAQKVQKESVIVLYSKLNLEITEVLKRTGFIDTVEKRGTKRLFLKLTLKYDNKKKPFISGIKKISKPGQKIYLGWKEINKVKSGYGITIVSTSKGLMTDNEVRKNKIGGEIICQVL